ncbi:dTDP-4-dehydrorhamnose reductase [Thermoanaerobacteraceae bacterium SP2]|nr:dTDP-4-dehydrorhamnose reductase [Thermoanaerobacteraceae bacterium SP2]
MNYVILELKDTVKGRVILTMRVLVTGASGLLGEAICNAVQKNHEVKALKGRADGDITDAGDIIGKIDDFNPDAVIHAAAIKDPDTAEKDPRMSYLVNCIGVRNVALAAQKIGAKMLYISTESVFDGEKRAPYYEYEKPNPVNVYGQTKLMGEQITMSLIKNYFIVRLPLLFGYTGKPQDNIILKNVGKIKNGEKVVAGADQYSQPTYVDMVADVIAKLIDTEYYGIYHVSNSGSASRYEFHKAVLEYLGMDDSNLIPASDVNMNRPAVRQRYVAMHNLALEATLGIKLPPWEEALRMCLDKMKSMNLVP